MKPMKLYNFLAFILAVNGLLAQHKTTAKIEAVKKSGLHKILLPAEIRSFSKEDLSDFRIFDAKETEVPYYIFQKNNETISSSFSEFKTLSKTVVPGKKTIIIFENPKASIDAIVLSITNSDVTKPFSISGSNKQKEWFGLINNSRLSELKNREDTSVFKTIPLPLSSYRYLKIDFDDRKTLPINVLKIGFFNNKTNNPDVTEIFAKSNKTVQIPAERKTRIYITFDHPQIVNQIRFKISNPNLFQRNMRIYVNKKSPAKHKAVAYQEILSDFELNSNHENSFTIPQLFEKKFFIEIENQDNQPLTFTEIRFFQHPISVIADLKAHEKYSIQTGNPKLHSPEYDLENFKNTIDSNLPEARIYAIKHTVSKKTTVQDKSFWQQAWFMWFCIGLGGIALAYFTTSLVKDMRKNT